MTEVYSILYEILSSHCPPLQTRNEKQDSIEFAGTKEAMQGKQKVDGYYFASIVQKPKDVRLYFFPIYTHASEFNISEDLNRMLKGKSCFHLKKLSTELEAELRKMCAKGVMLYQSDDLI